MEENYINTDGEVVDVATLNTFHLVNALIKNAKLSVAPEAEAQASINVKLLQGEIIGRLEPKKAE